MPTKVYGTPARARAIVISVARAEVEHFSIGAMGHNRGYIVVGCKYTAAAIHAEKTSVISGVYSARPILVHAGRAVAVRAGGAAAERGVRYVLTADIAKNGGRRGGGRMLRHVSRPG